MASAAFGQFSQGYGSASPIIDLSSTTDITCAVFFVLLSVCVNWGK